MANVFNIIIKELHIATRNARIFPATFCPSEVSRSEVRLHNGHVTSESYLLLLSKYEAKDSGKLK